MEEKKGFPYGKTFVVAFGFLGITIVWSVFNAYIPIFLQAGNPEFIQQLLDAGREIPDVKGFGLAPAVAFFVMTWDNIINVFVQPWAGAKSDKTWNRFGRRKPWILIGAPIAAIAFIFIPLANTVLAVMVFILLTNFGMALFRSPTVAWLGDLFSPVERSKANGVINLMGGLGAAIALFGGGYVFDTYGRFWPFLIGSVLMLVVLGFALLWVKEPEQIEAVEEKKRGVLDNLREIWQAENRSGIYILLSILLWFVAYEALSTGLSSFAVFVLGISPGRASMITTLMAVSFILFAIPSGLIATRVGRRKTINIGLIGLVVLFGSGYFFIQSEATLAVVLVLGGICWALVNVNSLPLVYDYGDERRIGAFTGLYYFSSQSAAILGPVLSGALVQSMGSQYRWLWVFSTVFMFLAWVAMRGVRDKEQVAV